MICNDHGHSLGAQCHECKREAKRRMHRRTLEVLTNGEE